MGSIEEVLAAVRRHEVEVSRIQDTSSEWLEAEVKLRQRALREHAFALPALVVALALLVGAFVCLVIAFAFWAPIKLLLDAEMLQLGGWVAVVWGIWVSIVLEDRVRRGLRPLLCGLKDHWSWIEVHRSSIRQIRKVLRDRRKQPPGE